MNRGKTRATRQKTRVQRTRPDKSFKERESVRENVREKDCIKLCAQSLAKSRNK